MRVLIVDDSKTARTICKRVLPATLLSDLVEASSGAEALTVCREQAIELMFLDLTMPEIDGYQVLETLQKEGRERPRVIIMSADVQPEAKERVLKLGALGFLPKPTNQASVVAFLREHGVL
ncbi:MAG TPA: response regulator [Polyangiaceae bacterium]|nr:response regulator [Polyangiaceae bacterium]